MYLFNKMIILFDFITFSYFFIFDIGMKGVPPKSYL